MKRFCTALLICALVFSLFIVPAIADDEFAVSFANCTKSASKLTDGRVDTDIAFDKGETITVEFSGAVGMMLKWYKHCKYNVELNTNEGKSLIVNYDDTIINRYIELNDADTANIKLPEGGRLCEIEVFFEEPPADTQVWEQPYEKLDILVLPAHPDDEYLYFGGTLPYYGTELGLNVNSVWMTHQKRLRQDEALNALWAMGIRHYPEFVGFPDRLKKTYESAAEFWGEEKTLGTIVELYRKYKPEVVVTHDPKGEYGHGAHMVTSALSVEAATVAADETMFPESAQLYGTWQVKKVYLHLLKRNEIYMGWDTPMKAFDGKTAMDMAKIGYSYHESQHSYNLRVAYDSKYACTRFGLAFSTVGIDVHGNDFLENIAANNLSNYVEPEPEGEPEPTTEPSPNTQEEPQNTEPPQVTTAPEQTVAQETQETSSSTKSSSAYLIWIAAVAAIIAVVASVTTVLFVRKKRRRH